MASQDTRLSKFEADFKQQQSEMTNKIHTVLKAIIDRITRTLPSDTVKNPKLNVNSTSLVLSARSYPMEDPHEELEQTLEDEFKDLHLNLPVLEVLAHAPMYNAILDKYVESLELGENGSTFIQGEMPKRMEDPGLFTLPYGTKSYPVGIVRDVEVHTGRLKLLNEFYVIDMKKDPETPLLVGRGFLAIANEVIDCRKAKIAVGEGITISIFGVKGIKLGKEEAPYWTTLGKRESYKPRPSSDGVGARTPYYGKKEKGDSFEFYLAEMASLLVKRVASNLSRVRTLASSSRFFSTKGYEFVQHDTKDECILKCDDSLGSSVARDAFSPHVPPTENLARLLNFSDLRISFFYGTHLFPRWSVVEDDKALYILRDMTAKDIEDVRESVKEFVTGDHEENFNEGVPVSEEEYISRNVKENFKQYDPKRNLLPIIDIMRGNEYAPTGEYYYHVMKDAKEVSQFVDSLEGSPDTVNRNINASIKTYGVPHKPQAVYNLVVLGNPETRNPYGGYAMEIFLDKSLYNVCDMKSDFTGFNRKFFIPKKKVEGTKTIGGKLIFFQEKKFLKPTPWRPT
ncbi:hypothetical protein Tco_0357101 [Tanacetum coccineum]